VADSRIVAHLLTGSRWLTILDVGNRRRQSRPWQVNHVVQVHRDPVLSFHTVHGRSIELQAARLAASRSHRSRTGEGTVSSVETLIDYTFDIVRHQADVVDALTVVHGQVTTPFGRGIRNGGEVQLAKTVGARVQLIAVEHGWGALELVDLGSSQPQGQVTTIDRHTVVCLDIETFGDLAWTITIVPADFSKVCCCADTLHTRATVEGDPSDQRMRTVSQGTAVGWHGATVWSDAEHGISNFVRCCQEAQFLLCLDVEIVNDQLDGAVRSEALGLPDGSQTPDCCFFRLN